MHDNSGISTILKTYRLVFAMTYSAEVPSIPLFRKDVATFSFIAQFMLIYYTMLLAVCQQVLEIFSKKEANCPSFYSFIILSIDCSLISLIILQLLSSSACSSSVNSRFNNSRTPWSLIIAGTPI